MEGGEEDIAALNEQLARVEEAKRRFLRLLRKWRPISPKKWRTIEERIKEMVDELDASAEARDADMSTIDGYIDGAESMRSSLESTYRSLANAANNAYKSTLDIHYEIVAPDCTMCVCSRGAALSRAAFRCFQLKCRYLFGVYDYA